MEWLLKRMLYELEDVKKYSTNEDNIIEKYAEMAEIQAKVKCGDIYTIEDFIEAVKDKSFIPYDGYGYYFDETQHNCKGDLVPFNVEQLLKDAQIYRYVIWHNR